MMITGNEDHFPPELMGNRDEKMKELKFLFQIVSNKE